MISDPHDTHNEAYYRELFAKNIAKLSLGYNAALE
jgi:hypothetical protein